MPDEYGRNDPLADMINLLAAPIAGGLRTVEQFRRGVDEMFRAVDNLNRTMETLNETARRVNGLLAELEEPIRASIPQLTRTIRAADEITRHLEGPVRASAPSIEKIAATLSSPAFGDLPAQFAELTRRLSPLAQLAENAGGLFGGFRIPGMPSRPDPSRGSGPTLTADVTAIPAETIAAKQRAAKKAPAKKAVAKKPTPKRATATRPVKPAS